MREHLPSPTEARADRIGESADMENEWVDHKPAAHNRQDSKGQKWDKDNSRTAYSFDHARAVRRIPEPPAPGVDRPRFPLFPRKCIRHSSEREHTDVCTYSKLHLHVYEDGILYSVLSALSP